MTLAAPTSSITGRRLALAALAAIALAPLAFAQSPAASQPTGTRTTTPSGLTIIDQGQDSTVAKPGDTVSVHYTGKLEDGTVFDSSLKRGTPFSFTIGAGNVIKGWDEGVAGMRPGDKRTLIIPPDLGYGSNGAGNGLIPPNATLTFEVQVLYITHK